MKSLHQLREEIARLSQGRETSAGLRSLGWVFLKLGFTGFGGGIAVIAQIRSLGARSISKVSIRRQASKEPHTPRSSSNTRAAAPQKSWTKEVISPPTVTFYLRCRRRITTSQSKAVNLLRLSQMLKKLPRNCACWRGRCRRCRCWPISPRSVNSS